MKSGHYYLPSGELISVGALVHGSQDDWNAKYMGGSNSGESVTVSGAFLVKWGTRV